MTNPLRNQIEVELGGKNYKARLTVDSLIRIEEAIGQSVISLVQSMSNGDVRLKYILEVLLHSFRGGGNDLQEKDIKKIVGDAGIVESTKVVADILTKTLVNSEEEDQEQLKKKE